MPLHGFFQFIFAGIGWQGQLCIEGINLEVIAVYPIRRTRPAISILSEIIDALFPEWRIFVQVLNNRNIPCQPVHPGPDGRIGVINDQRQAFGRRRNIGNIERGINAPSFETLEKLGEVLRVPVDELFRFPDAEE